MKCADCNYYYQTEEDSYPCCQYQSVWPAPCECDYENDEEYMEEDSSYNDTEVFMNQAAPMKTLILESFGEEHKITLEIANYSENDNLYVGLVCWDNVFPERWSDATVNLGIKLDADKAFIDVNNNSKRFVDWLVDNGLGEPTGVVGYSGWCEYPEFKFNMDKVAEYCYKHYW